MPRPRSFVSWSGGLKPLPPATTRSAPIATIFSTSMAVYEATSGKATAAGG